MAASETSITVHVTPDYDYPDVAAEMTRRFTYHAPTGDQPDRYQAIREGALSLALTIVALCPPSSERAAALQHLDEAVMQANASIARREEPAS